MFFSMSVLIFCSIIRDELIVFETLALYLYSNSKRDRQSRGSV
jgi:hypothetical protein